MSSLEKQYEMQQLNDAAKQSLKNLPPPPPPPSYDLLPKEEGKSLTKGQLESTKEGKSLIKTLFKQIQTFYNITYQIVSDEPTDSKLISLLKLLKKCSIKICILLLKILKFSVTHPIFSIILFYTFMTIYYINKDFANIVDNIVYGIVFIARFSPLDIGAIDTAKYIRDWLKLIYSGTMVYVGVVVAIPATAATLTATAATLTTLSTSVATLTAGLAALNTQTTIANEAQTQMLKTIDTIKNQGIESSILSKEQYDVVNSRIEDYSNQLTDYIHNFEDSIAQLEFGQKQLEFGQQDIMSSQLLLEFGQQQLTVGQLGLITGQSSIVETIYGLEQSSEEANELYLKIEKFLQDIPTANDANMRDLQHQYSEIITKLNTEEHNTFIRNIMNVAPVVAHGAVKTLKALGRGNPLLLKNNGGKITKKYKYNKKITKKYKYKKNVTKTNKK